MVKEVMEFGADVIDMVSMGGDTGEQPFVKERDWVVVWGKTRLEFVGGVGGKSGVVGRVEGMVRGGGGLRGREGGVGGARED